MRPRNLRTTGVWLLAVLLLLIGSAAPAGAAGAPSFRALASPQPQPVTAERAWGWGVADGQSQFGVCSASCQWGVDGAGAGQLSWPAGVAVDARGNAFVAEPGSARNDEFTSAGAFERAWGAGTNQLMASLTDGGAASPAHAVADNTTTISLASSITAPEPSQPFTLTATFSPSGSIPIMGTVEFLDNGSVISQCLSQQIGESGRDQLPFFAFCQLTYPTIGSHSFVAQYGGDLDYPASTSPPLTLTVTPIGSGQLPLCRGQDQVVADASQQKARSAVLCLLDEVRARYGIPALLAPAELAMFAQAHPGTDIVPPSLNSAHGASLFFDNIGRRTPYALVAAYMRSTEECFDVLSETEVGVGVVARPVIQTPPAPGIPAFAASPSWTLVLAATAPPDNPPAASACPHPLPTDEAGQGAPPPRHAPSSDLSVFSATSRGRSLLLGFIGQSRKPVSAGFSVRVGAVALHRVEVRHLRALVNETLVLPLGARARQGLHPGAIVSVVVVEHAPQHASYLFELRL